MSTHNDASHPVIIAGAGIGGLTAALALRQNGHSVIVMEKARELSEVGAGLQLSPNACSVLDRLDVLSSLKATAYAPENLRLWSGETGRQLARVRLGAYLEQRHGQPFWVIHRADLQRALLEKVHQTPGVDLRLGAEILDLSPSPYGHLVCIYQTDEINGNLDCKALIGADGVWSKTRKLVPAHQNAHFSGQVAYRATIPLDKLPARWSGDSGLWLHKNSHLVHYPIRGGRELNIVALAEEAWQDETWSAREEKETVLRVFKNWPADVRNLLKASETWLKWALCSVDASGPWTHGHLALMGDAAHAMLPYMAQGAGMAIEDAAILAKHLPADVENVPAALRAFERERKPRVKRVQETASGNARTFHLSGIPAFARDTFLRWSKPEALTARYDDIYGWTPER